MIKTNTFYKAKKSTPGGYIYIKEVNAGKVKFAVTETPTESALTGGYFTISAKDIFNLIECEYIAN